MESIGDIESPGASTDTAVERGTPDVSGEFDGAGDMGARFPTLQLARSTTVKASDAGRMNELLAAVIRFGETSGHSCRPGCPCKAREPKAN
jgi:hypothetical protein